MGVPATGELPLKVIWVPPGSMTDMVRVVPFPAITTVMPTVKSAVVLSPVTTAEVVRVVPVRAGAAVPTTELMVNESLALSVRTTSSLVVALVLLVTLMLPPLMVPVPVSPMVVSPSNFTGPARTEPPSTRKAPRFSELPLPAT